MCVGGVAGSGYSGWGLSVGDAGAAVAAVWSGVFTGVHIKYEGSSARFDQALDQLIQLNVGSIDRDG